MRATAANRATIRPGQLARRGRPGRRAAGGGGPSAGGLVPPGSIDVDSGGCPEESRAVVPDPPGGDGVRPTRLAPWMPVGARPPPLGWLPSVGRVPLAGEKGAGPSHRVDCASVANSACRTALDDAGRSSGRLARSRSTRSSREGGTLGWNWRTCGAAVLRCWTAVAMSVGPANGGRPVSISNNTTPRA
jgi:hypothetical protein